MASVKQAKIPLGRLSKRQLVGLDACTRCGECMKWCPVYAVNERTELVPRSKIAGVRTLLKSQQGLGIKLFTKKGFSQEEVDKLVESLYECTACGQCHFVCPARIDTTELWESLREVMAEAGLGPTSDQKTYLEVLKEFENPFKEPRENRGSWVSRGLAQGTLFQDVPLITESPQPVLFYLGCTASYNEKINLVAQQVANLMTEGGIKYGILGAKENCCRGKLRRMGDLDFEAMATENIDLLNSLGIETLVTNCAGCYKTIFQDYAKVKPVNFKIYHAIEYVDILIREGKLKPVNPIPLKVTYHDPCHLGRHNQIYDAPRRVLNSIPGIEFIEMDRIRQNSRCCGFGGGVKMGFPQTQLKMSALRIKEAESKGVSEITTPCPTCFLGLSDGIVEAKSEVKVRHLIDLLHLSVFKNKGGVKNG